MFSEIKDNIDLSPYDGIIQLHKISTGYDYNGLVKTTYTFYLYVTLKKMIDIEKHMNSQILITQLTRNNEYVASDVFVIDHLDKISNNLLRIFMYTDRYIKNKNDLLEPLVKNKETFCEVNINEFPEVTDFTVILK